MNPSIARTRVTLFAALAVLLATAALWPLLQTAQWPYSAVVTIAVLAATGWLCRALRVPALLTVLAYLVMLLVVLTVLHTRESALLGIVPTPTSLRDLGDLAIQGLIDVRRFATPAPESDGLLLVTVGGIGLIAATTDLIGVRLGHPAVAGLPLLALYSVSAGVLTKGPNWVTFLAGAIGFLALLLADRRERVEVWGRPVGIRRSWERRTAKVSRQRPNTAALASVGRRLGVFAVAVAVAVPMFVPLTDQAFLAGDGQGGAWLRRFGAPTMQAPDPVVSMRRTLLNQTDEVLFRYATSAERPDYLRTVSLTEFDGRAWTAGRMRGYDEYALDEEDLLTPPVGTDLTSAATVRTTVTLRDRMSLKYLAAPYAPSRVDAGDGWYYDQDTLTVFSPRGSATGLRYRVISEVPQPRPTQLDVASPPSEGMRRYLRLPENLPPEVRRHARDLTEDKDNAYKKALALQEWFTDTGGFTYSTEPGGNGRNALREFLRDRRGYCEQYASAMAVMARMIGIPARVAIGFTQGTQTGAEEWAVRGKDAHAWPELWFEDVGWIRFEPTPAGFAGQGNAEVPGYSEPDALQRNDPDDGDVDPGIVATNNPGQPSVTPSRRDVEATDEQRADGARRTGLGTPLLLGLLGAAAAGLLVAMVPAVSRRVLRRRRWARAQDQVRVAHVAWAEVEDDGLDLGFTFSASESPRAAGERLAAYLTDSSAAAAARRIALAEERARYAQVADTPAELRADVRMVHSALARRANRRTRLHAFLMPRSVRWRLRTWWRTSNERLLGFTARRSEA